MDDQRFSRPIHRHGSQGDGYMITRSTRISAITVRPQDGDVLVRFTDGAGGQELWSVEADNASGSHFECFGAYPLLAKQGVYITVVDDSGLTNWDVSIAVIEPMSAGT